MNISPINSNLIQSNYKTNNVQKAQNVSFSGYIKTTSPVYMIDIKGSVIKFSNINEAQERLGVDKKELYDKVKNGEYFDNFAIVYAEDVEKNVPDLEKINEAAKNIKETSFYLVDMFGDYRKYGSLKEAACDLNIQPDNISAALNKRRQTVGGLVAYRPSEMETLNENGKVEIDDCRVSAAKKILEYRNKNNLDAYTTPFKGKKWTDPVYVIDIHSRYRKYPSELAASYALNVNHATLVTALRKGKGIGDYAIKKASDVEITHLDEEKVEEIRQKLIDNKKEKINENNAISTYAKAFIINKD